MAIERKDRVQEETTTTGTGTVDLSGTAPTGYRTFVSAVTSGATVRYLIEFADKSEWEVGEGVFTDASPDTLTRVTVYASSNAGSLVDFSAGTKNVSLVLVAEDVKTQETPYKIVPSVASNNLTVALKHMDGTDATVARPIWKKIGDSFYAITSALSVTKNAATNWCNAGSAKLATQIIHHFVYLGYNATDGVVIGFSRISYANLYSDFSATTTNDKYCAISTITNAVAGDTYVNIGRFAATLSAGAGYTWTVPTFTDKNLIQEPIFKTGLLSFNGVYGGFSTPPTQSLNYILNGRILTLFLATSGNGGTSNSTSFTLEIPFDLSIFYRNFCLGSDNSSAVFVKIATGTGSTLEFKNGVSGANFTASGTKGIEGQIDILI